MDKFFCDYVCRTVGESITKYDIPDDWEAEFYAWEEICPAVCVPVGEIRRCSAAMDLQLRIVEDPDEEYAGCMVYANRHRIVFKIDYVSRLQKALS